MLPGANLHGPRCVQCTTCPLLLSCCLRTGASGVVHGDLWVCAEELWG